MDKRVPPLYELGDNGTVRLFSPTLLPNACGFLWNANMMIQMNCRGYAQAQHMQPEPAKYARGPAIEAQTFMQPEHHYYANHPGRFVYIKEENKPLFSIPYEPVRCSHDEFIFEHHQHKLEWTIKQHDLLFKYTLMLAENDAVERWSFSVTNTGKAPRSFSVIPYFPMGYMSWMHQRANFDPAVNAIIASSITPYQRTEDYPKNKHLKDKTFFASNTVPNSWTSVQTEFEGNGGLRNPDALQTDQLPQTAANYEVPMAAMQFDLTLVPDEERQFEWLFGPAETDDDIATLCKEHFNTLNNTQSAEPAHAIAIETPDPAFDHFVNHWLLRQIRYHTESNRLTTDPQTRNFLQDHMAMIYLQPDAAKQAFLHALKQQSAQGDFPDGILMHKDATLKYINQIPHSDHNVWAVIFIAFYLDETNDRAFLDQLCPFNDGTNATIRTHIELALNRLLDNLDERSLAYIHQGDWCDPMNMVGYKGKGVSAWLTMATAYCCDLWAKVISPQPDPSIRWSQWQQKLNDAINHHFWASEWFGRGITDDGRTFGVPEDDEGRIYLNAQSWAMLCGALKEDKTDSVLQAIESQLRTPYGPMLLAPSYTKMQEDIGRLTQKSAGVAENGAVYNHAAAFYAAALFEKGQSELGYRTLREMIPDQSDVLTRGQLPVYIPNYYRGAYFQFPTHAGRSSHLFNTGTISWFLHSLVTGLYGLKGTEDGLEISPQLPKEWPKAAITKQFRDVEYVITYQRSNDANRTEITADGASVTGNSVHSPTASRVLITVTIPMESKVE